MVTMAPAGDRRPWSHRWLHGGGGAPGALLRSALLPAEWVYRLAAGARGVAYDHGMLAVVSAGVPVVSVGNLAVGGSGKTPFTRWLVDRLLARARRPAVLHGGYAEDEPALHRGWHPDVPVYAARDRVASARAAVAAGADVLVLDDGFQHRRLRRDLDVVLVSAESRERPPHLLPRGPWREPLTALRRAGLVVVTRRAADAGAAGELAARLSARCAAPIARVWIRPAAWRDPAGAETPAPAGPVLAVAGVADPEAFFANAADAGARVAERLVYPDHHAYDGADAAAIRDRAAGRAVVTTAKDAVKLTTLGAPADLRILVQEVVVEEGEAMLETAIDRVLA